jgi:7-carboxy-7-deazaguanine synthase
VSKFYSVKEVYPTIQGEGVMTGTPAVFVRFTGCNAWSGREVDRATDSATKAPCAAICDTDFLGTDGINGGKYEAPALVRLITRLANGAIRWVVLTGGEPLLQADESFADALRRASLLVAVETNGSILPKWRPDWLCVSPKPPLPVKIDVADEVKVLVPLYDPEEWASKITATHYSIQPVGPGHVSLAAQMAMDHGWRLSLQTHKLIGLQ